MPPNGRSPRAAAAFGAKRERDEVAYRRDAGWLAFRVGGHSATRGQADAFDVCDVVASRAVVLEVQGGSRDGLQTRVAELLLIEVKTTAQGPYERFGPKERAALKAAAEVAGATALLVWWPPRGERREIPAAEWPQAKEPAAT